MHGIGGSSHGIIDSSHGTTYRVCICRLIRKSIEATSLDIPNRNTSCILICRATRRRLGYGASHHSSNLRHDTAASLVSSFSSCCTSLVPYLLSSARRQTSREITDSTICWRRSRILDSAMFAEPIAICLPFPLLAQSVNKGCCRWPSMSCLACSSSSSTLLHSISCGSSETMPSKLAMSSLSRLGTKPGAFPAQWSLSHAFKFDQDPRPPLSCRMPHLSLKRSSGVHCNQCSVGSVQLWLRTKTAKVFSARKIDIPSRRVC